MTKGYLLVFYGGSEAFAETLDDAKLLVEAFLESPLYAREEGMGFLFLGDVIEHITQGILYSKLIPLGESEEIEFPLPEGTQIKDLFIFTLKISGDNLKLQVKFRKNLSI